MSCNCFSLQIVHENLEQVEKAIGNIWCLFFPKEKAKETWPSSTSAYCLIWWFPVGYYNCHYRKLQMITESDSMKEKCIGTFSLGYCIGWQWKHYEYFTAYDLCDLKRIIVLLRLTMDWTKENRFNWDNYFNGSKHLSWKINFCSLSGVQLIASHICKHAW